MENCTACGATSLKAAVERYFSLSFHAHFNNELQKRAYYPSRDRS
jgi:hypothetical protein